MSLSRAAIRARAYAQIIGLGFARDADSVDVDGIVDAGKFLDTDAAEGDFVKGWQYRPGQSDPNRVKVGAAVSGSKWTQSQSPYDGASLSDTAYEGLGYLHPDILNECIRLALHDVFFETYAPLGPWTDNDFASTGVSGFTATDTTPTKVTSAGYTQAGQSGFRNLLLTNSNSNGHVTTSSFYVTPGEYFVHGAIARVNGAYTGNYRLYDVTNAANISSTSFTSRQFERILKVDTIPSGCYEVKAWLEGAESNAVTEWDCLFGHLLGAETRQVVCPDWLTERWRILGFGPADYSPQLGSGIYNAQSRSYLNWQEGRDYSTYPVTEEANPFILQVNRAAGLGHRDYWIHGLRPHSDITELLTESETTDAPEELLMAAVRYRVFSALHIDQMDQQGNSPWLGHKQEAFNELIQRRQVGAAAVGATA